MSLKFKFDLNLTRTTGALHEDQYTFLIVSRSVLLRVRNVAHESCGEYQNIHFRCNKLFREPCSLSDNVEKYYTAGQTTDGSMVLSAFQGGYLSLQTHTQNIQ